MTVGAEAAGFSAAASAAGAAGAILKDASNEDLIDSIKRVAAGERLEVDSGDAVVRVCLGGRDLGARGWAPFAWEIPANLAGRELPLEIEVVTSVRPIFGDPDAPDAKLDHSLWIGTTLVNPPPAGLRGAFAVARDATQTVQ